MKSEHTEVLIIGAGIIGIATAYYLKQSKPELKVTLLDQFQPMTLTSAQSGENYRNWWSHPSMRKFMERSISLMEDIAIESHDRIQLTRRGYLLSTRADDVSEIVNRIIGSYDDGEDASVYQYSSHNAHKYQPPITEAWQNAPQGVDLLNDSTMIKKHFPNLDPAIRNVIHIRQAGMVDSQQMATFMMEKFIASGGKKLIGKVVNINKTDDFKVTVSGDVETITATQVVNAAGPFINDITKMLGLDLPIKNILQQKIAFPDTLKAIPRNLPFAIDLDPQTIDWDAEEQQLLKEDPEFSWLTKQISGGIHCRPEGGDHGNWLKLGWAFNQTAVDAATNPELNAYYPEIVLRGAARLNPALKAYYGGFPRNMIHYGGYYTTTKENWPIIGPTAIDGFYINGAMSGFGTMAACASGELCSQWLLNKETASYAKGFSLARYQDKPFMADLKNYDTGIL